MEHPHRERLSGVLEALGSRSAADLAVLWMGVVLGCTVLYWLASALPGNGLTVLGQTEPFGFHSLLTSLYFSMVTATSVGYGDVAPHGISRILATCEAVAALLIFGGMVSKFVSARQDRLIEQMNRNTFEDHLGRVRTNLHLIVSDLRSIADRCSDGSIHGVGLHSRMESGAALLAGEMRTIHELLQGKDQMPDEESLDGILTCLVACFQAVIDLRACLPADILVTDAMRKQSRTIGELAVAICGDCIPLPFAARIHEQMDEVRRRGQAVEATVGPEEVGGG